MKYLVEADESLANFFKENFGENESVETTLSKMFEILYEIFKVSNPL